MPPRKRATFAEALERTHALRTLRGTTPARLEHARMAALAPQAPEAAMRAYGSVMATHAERTRKLVERHVLSQLPVLGSGDPLDVAALERGLQELQGALYRLSDRVRRSARAAGERASLHARREVGRIMQVQVPLKDAKAAFAVAEFEQRQVEALKRVARAQVEHIRKAIHTYKEGESMRERILHQIWVTRNRGVLLAHDELHQIHQETVREWSLAVGSEGFIYVDREDNRVRAHHHVHHGKWYRWAEAPGTLQEYGCRCQQLPFEAPELQ